MSSWGYGNSRYKPAAEKKAQAAKNLAKLQKKNPQLAPIIIEGRKIARTWWGIAWNDNLERYADFANRIERGRSYVRQGAVLDLQISPGEINALVQGSRKQPYQVRIVIDPLRPEAMSAVASSCAGNIHSLQELVEGKFPKNMSELFTSDKNGLFPNPREIRFACSCPDWAGLCKHVAAVLYGIGARLDQDPTLFFALRQNPDCTYAVDYARVLQSGYPHIIAEIGGEAIMLDVREVDSPYLDRKVNLLKIMALLEPDKAGLWREIGRTLMEKGSRMEAAHLAVQSWYGAEKYLTHSLELDPEDLHTSYQLGETHYVLGHYDQALTLWEPLFERLTGHERTSLKARIAAIQAGELPKVPAVDYLTALSVAFEQHQDDQFYEAAAIVEDVLEDTVFCAQFPMAGVYRFLEQCYRAVNLTDQADAVRGRC